MQRRFLRRRTRRLTVGLAAAVFVSAVIATIAAATGGGPTLDRDINHYVLFAQHSIAFDGGNAAFGARIEGIVGVNDVGGSFRACTGGSKHPVQFKNAQVAAYKITLGAGCTGATVFSHADGTQFPIVTALPSFPGDTGCGNTDVDTKNQKAVPPGAYRDLIVRANQGIALASGVYFFCNVSVAKGGSLSVDDGTTVYVRSTMNVGNDAWVTAGTDDGAVRVQWYVEGWLVPEKDSSVSFARGAHFRGWLYAKDQKVALGHASDIEGHVWAGSMVSDWNVTVEPPPGPPPTTVPQTSGPPPTTVPQTSGPPPTTVPQTSGPPPTVPPTTAPTTVPDTVPL